MARRLGFRLWSAADKEYRDDCKLVFDRKAGTPSTEFCDDGNCFVIEQYTGLKDKNGKEIYEGDIVKYEGSVAIIIWREKNAGFSVRWLDCGVEDELDYWDTFRGPAEVIGNIHENPDLLK